MNEQQVRDLFERVTRALRDGDYRTVASLCDPASLSLFKQGSVDRIASFGTWDLSVEEMMRGSPKMPREVAEFNITELQQHRAEHDPLAHDFPRVGSLQDLCELDPVDVFAEWLYARSPEYALKCAIARGDVPAEGIDFVSASAGSRHTFELCCVIAASERIAEIVFRRRWGMDGAAITDEEFEASDPEFAEMRAQMSDDERQLQRDLALFPLDFAQCRVQPDGSWKMIADDRFLNRQGGTFFYGFGVE